MKGGKGYGIFSPGRAYNAPVKGDEMMGAGRLKIKRYKTRRNSRGWLLLAVILLLATLGTLLWGRESMQGLLIFPSPTLSPSESRQDTRTVTLPGKSWFALQLGVFENEESARELAESFRARGAGALVTQQGNYRVLAAAYESRADAQMVQNQLRSQHGVEAYIWEIARQEIMMKISGQAAQLTALTDAYDALSQAELQLSSLSQGLDQNAMEKEAIDSALRSMRDTVSALQNRLHALFGENAHPAVRNVIALLSQTENGLAAALGSGSSLELGSKIKYCQLLVITGLAAYGEALASR